MIEEIDNCVYMRQMWGQIHQIASHEFDIALLTILLQVILKMGRPDPNLVGHRFYISETCIYRITDNSDLSL